MEDILIIEEDCYIRDSIPRDTPYNYLHPSEISLNMLLSSGYKLIIISIFVRTPDSIQIGRMFTDSRLVIVTHKSSVFREFLCRESHVELIKLEDITRDYMELKKRNITERKLPPTYSKKEYLTNTAFLSATLMHDSLNTSIKYIFDAISLILKDDIIILILNIAGESTIYSQFTKDIKRNNYDSFLKFCYHNHHESIPRDNPTNSKEFFLNIQENPNFEKVILNNRKISSYFSSPINNKKEEIIGTIHLGNYVNNYFTNDKLRNILLESFDVAGIILGKNIQYSNAVIEKYKIRNIFSKFVPDKLIDRDLEKGVIEKTGELKRVAILFTDIRAFTTISENNEPEVVVSFLNNFFNIMVKCIKDEGGVIDKFIGDAIVAIFGAPENLDNPAQRAVNSALAMIKNVPNVSTENLVLPPMGFVMGIGLHIGDSIIGNIGSSDKMSYASIGNVTTLAEKLEELTKKYKKGILLSKAIKEDISNTVTKVDTIDIEGEDLIIYTVL